MDLELRDKAYLVAGSSRGIGRGVAESLLEEGARVMVTGRGQAPLESTVKDFVDRYGKDRVSAHAGDLTDPKIAASAVKALEDQWGSLQGVVANIGSGAVKRGWEISSEEWDQSFDTNLWASVRVVEACVPALIKGKGGSVVFISSIAGLEEIGAPTSYSVAKAALHHYAKSLARQLGPQKIRVNSVAPGNVFFPGGSWERKQKDNPSGIEQFLSERVPLGRFGTPREIADLVAFLLSDRASFITGSCYVADGGQTVRV